MIMVHGSSMSILDENGVSVASALRGAIACMAFLAASTFLTVAIDDHSYAQ